MDNDSSIAAVAAVIRAEAGRRQPGDRLPSTRELVSRLGVGPVTVSRALAGLAADGIVITRPGAGTFVAARPARMRGAEHDYSWQTLTLGGRRATATGVLASLDTPPPGDIPMASGYLHPSLLPARALSAAMARAARRPGAWGRPPVAGIEGLRAWFASVAGGNADAADVIITPGAQGALTAAFRAVAGASGTILLESPTYPGAMAVAAAAGIAAVPVPVDDDGIVPDALARAFTATGAAAVYCQPTYQNPAGALLAAGRRAELLEIAASAGAFVIEDDYGRWLAHERPPPPPLIAQDDAGRVVHIASLTKPASPSLRVGALIARGPVAERLRAIRVIDDYFVSRPLQEAALELVGSPAWQRHLANLGRTLALRRTALAEALARYLPRATVPVLPGGGASLWVRLPPRVVDTRLTARASRAGVAISPGRSFFPAEAPGSFIRLSFAAAPRAEDLPEGVRRLAAALDGDG